MVETFNGQNGELNNDYHATHSVAEIRFDGRIGVTVKSPSLPRSCTLSRPEQSSHSFHAIGFTSLPDRILFAGQAVL